MTVRGISAWQKAFAHVYRTERAAFMPYWPLGFPSPGETLPYLEALVSAGADMLELGIPFSDPLADGSTIQAATQQALARGTRVTTCLELAATLRARGISLPFAVMTYINPVLAYGLERFVSDAAALGADGLIIPDLPPEEGEILEPLCQEHGIALIYLLAPTSTEERIALAAQHSSGFLYLVSVTGITGERAQLPSDLAAFVQRVRGHTPLPLAVGFGISTPAQAREVARVADGVIVGSALVRAAQDALSRGEDGVRAVQTLAASLANGAHGNIPSDE